jgi:hypothetical protein
MSARSDLRPVFHFGAAFSSTAAVEQMWKRCKMMEYPGTRSRSAMVSLAAVPELQARNLRKGLENQCLSLIPTFPQPSATTAVYILTV